MALLEHRVPPREAGGPPPHAGEAGLFEKLWGLKVLRERSQWTVRSVRDLRAISRQSGVPVRGSRPATEDKSA